jgi:hypothetical protein
VRQREARTLEFGDFRHQLGLVAERERRDEIRAGFHQRETDQAEGRVDLRARDAEHGLKQGPRAGVEELEHPRIPDDSGGSQCAHSIDSGSVLLA